MGVLLYQCYARGKLQGAGRHGRGVREQGGMGEVAGRHGRGGREQHSHPTLIGSVIV